MSSKLNRVRVIGALGCALGSFLLGWKFHSATLDAFSCPLTTEPPVVNADEIAGGGATGGALTEEEAIRALLDVPAGEPVPQASGGCEYNGEIWVCANGLGWLADELNTAGEVSDDPVETSRTLATTYGTADIITSTTPWPSDGAEVVFVPQMAVEVRGRFTWAHGDNGPYPWFEWKAHDGASMGINGDYVGYWRPVEQEP